MRRMGSHQSLQYRLEHLLFLLAVVEKAERSTRIHRRVLADHFSPRLWSRHRPRHVGEFRIAREAATDIAGAALRLASTLTIYVLVRVLAIDGTLILREREPESA
jgi:hypothetical protein